MNKFIPTPDGIAAFTQLSPSRARQLTTRIKIAPYFDPNSIVSEQDYLSRFTECTGIWDTGATNSVVSDTLAKQLALPVVQMTQTITAAGPVDSPVYRVNLILNTEVPFHKVRITEGTVFGKDPDGNPIDMLIGMDIITQGDFAITTHQGRTVFTFEHPSARTLDFTQQHPSSQKCVPLQKQLGTPEPGRNDPCWCGSGQKYKRCHGK